MKSSCESERAERCQGLAAVRMNKQGRHRPFSSIVPEAAEAKGAEREGTGDWGFCRNCSSEHETVLAERHP